MELVAQLRDVVDYANNNIEDVARTRLAAVTEFSLNERETLDQLGEPHEWPRRLLELGPKAFLLAQDLSAPEWHSSYIVQDAVDPAEPFCGIPRLGLELTIANHLVSSLHHRVARTQEIVWEAVIAELSPRVAGYLGRLGRCYVAGFDAEVVILCRSVLDVALRDALGDGVDAKMSMAGREKEAISRGLLTDEGAAAVQEVRLRGNAAVHEEPASTEIVRSTIDSTIRVLEELFGDQWER